MNQFKHLVNGIIYLYKNNNGEELYRISISKSELQMNQQVRFFLISFSIAIMFSCSSYERQEGCTLEKLHIYGNVKKIEVTSLTTVPLTEMFADVYNPEEALPIFSGNFNMNFDNTGNIKGFSGFGVDGKELFHVNKFRISEKTNFAPAFFGAKEIEEVNDLKIIRDSKGNICEINYLQEKEPLWIVKMKYNEKGDVVQITKKYCKLNEISLGLLNFADTTTICYHDCDKHGNWTKANVQYRGVLKKHNFEYTAIRVITYDTDANKPSILSDFQQTLSFTQKAEDCGFVKESTPILTIEVPDFMSRFSSADIKKVQSFSPINSSMLLNYLFMYEYKGKDSYASFSAMITPSGGINYDELSGTDLIYNSETDKLQEDAFRSQTSQNGIFLLKWLPYKVVKLGGKKSLKISYYRYGIGSPIPVYVETYTMSINDNYVVNLTISYQSKDYYRFYNCFEHSKQSLKFIN